MPRSVTYAGVSEGLLGRTGIAGPAVGDSVGEVTGDSVDGCAVDLVGANDAGRSEGAIVGAGVMEGVGEIVLAGSGSIS